MCACQQTTMDMMTIYSHSVIKTTMTTNGSYTPQNSSALHSFYYVRMYATPDGPCADVQELDAWRKQ